MFYFYFQLPYNYTLNVIKFLFCVKGLYFVTFCILFTLYSPVLLSFMFDRKTCKKKNVLLKSYGYDFVNGVEDMESCDSCSSTDSHMHIHDAWICIIEAKVKFVLTLEWHYLFLWSNRPWASDRITRRLAQRKNAGLAGRPF